MDGTTTESVSYLLVKKPREISICSEELFSVVEMFVQMQFHVCQIVLGKQLLDDPFESVVDLEADIYIYVVYPYEKFHAVYHQTRSLATDIWHSGPFRRIRSSLQDYCKQSFEAFCYRVIPM